MKSKSQISLILMTFLLLSSHVFSQDEEYVEVGDFESWSSLELKYKAGKKWSFGLQEQLRLDNNSSEVKNYFTQFTTDYELFKKVEIGFGLRYIRRNDNEGKIQGYRSYFRYHFDAKYKHKISDFSLRYRMRYQNKNELGVSVDDGDLAVEYLRFQAKVEYDIRSWKFDPILSGEIFNSIEEGVNQGLDGYRITLGTDVKIHNNGKLGVFYRIQNEINTDHPKTTYILRLKYSYTIK